MGLLLRLPDRTVTSPAGGTPEATGRPLFAHCDYSRPGVDPWWMGKPTDPPEHGTGRDRRPVSHATTRRDNGGGCDGSAHEAVEQVL